MRKYITTAIAYTNGSPHIGHLYEYTIADIINRYYHVLGTPTYFLTGTDEHGQKIANTAQERSCTPQELCDELSAEFKELHTRLGNRYDRFIRTSSLEHHSSVKDFFKRIQHDIEFGEYQGWYNNREECFVAENVAAKTNYTDPVTQKPFIKVSEPSLFFRLDRYRDKIINYIKGSHIYPEHYRDTLLKTIEDELRPLSISRQSVKWGISVPAIDGLNIGDQVFYVWFDALINYITGIDKYQSPIHIIGKDIVWFHSVVWIGMLLSAGLPLPERVFVHGFVVDERGEKMSKSVGNVISPGEVFKQLPVSTVRFALAQSPSGGDVKFSFESFTLLHNTVLIAKYGNMINRAVNLIVKNKFKIKENINPISISPAHIRKLVEEFKISEIVKLAMMWCDQLNMYIQATECWNTQSLFDTQQSLQTIGCGIVVVSRMLYPILPQTTQLVLNWFGVNHHLNGSISGGWWEGKQKLELLFNKLE